MGGPPKESSSDDIIRYLKEIDRRLTRIESELDLTPSLRKAQKKKLIPSVETGEQSNESLEFHIGQFWFAKAGIVVLAIGIAFLLTFPYKNLPAVVPSIFGYMLVAVIFILSHLWRKSFKLISRYLLGGGLILLYFTTLRLHYFGPIPTLQDKSIELVLLLIVVAINLAISLRRNSIYLTGLSLILGYVTAIVSDRPYFIFTTLVLLSGVAVFLRIKYGWYKIYTMGIILTYFTHFLWFLNNPMMGHRIELVTSPFINIVFILIYAMIFSLGNIFRDREKFADNAIISTTFLNSFGCYALFLLLTATKFLSNFAFSHFSASLLFLFLSIVFWVREKSKYSTFFYAITGYTALSSAIVVQFGKPDFFMWLCWQSLLVISTAIWFRSKFIILANFIIFILIFITHLILATDLSMVSLSFGIAAMISARILNWKKHRLELKTEFMRNAYLTTAFIVFPYALYQIVPSGYVSLAWVGLTLFYFALSILLKNIKYRWMALGTLLLTVLYVFVIGIIKLEPVYRVISFIVLGSVLIIISLLYTRLRAKNN